MLISVCSRPELHPDLIWFYQIVVFHGLVIRGADTGAAVVRTTVHRKTLEFLDAPLSDINKENDLNNEQKKILINYANDIRS